MKTEGKCSTNLFSIANAESDALTFVNKIIHKKLCLFLRFYFF